MKTIQQITENLSKKYEGVLLEKGGYSYIPWSSAIRHLGEAVGIDGYDLEISNSQQEIVGETIGYSAIVRITIYSSDGRAFSREGLGFNELQVTGSGVAMIDTSIKGAVSGAATRAIALLGDFGGLFLYDKEAPAGGGYRDDSKNQKAYTGGTSSAGGNKINLSPARLSWLEKTGFSVDQINQIRELDWKVGAEVFNLLKATSGDDKAKRAAVVQEFGLQTLQEAGKRAQSSFPSELDDDSQLPY